MKTLSTKNKLIFMIVLLLISIFLVTVTVSEIFVADASSLKVGSSGEKVREVQQKLVNWGYMSGRVDGSFGSITQQGVKRFQQKNRLTSDGIVGPATARALGVNISGSSSGGTSNENGGSIKLGSSGGRVKELQQKLVSWGYMNGSADGIFGSITQQGVKAFQRKNGLTADGIVGPATARALGLSNSGSSGGGSSGGGTSTSSDLNLLARVIHGEARGEVYTGQVAVAAVVMNRLRSSSFPNTMAGVVYQQGAFDCVSDGQINLAPDQSSIRAAQDALNGWDPTNGCLYYYNPRTATNAWMLARPVKLVIGLHNFC